MLFINLLCKMLCICICLILVSIAKVKNLLVGKDCPHSKDRKLSKVRYYVILVVLVMLDHSRARKSHTVKELYRHLMKREEG